MNTSLVKKWHRNPEIIFYDVTNFFFEIEEPDEDILDDDGEPNFLERLRESFRLGDSIIPELEEYTGKKPPIEKYTILLQEGDPECVGHPRLYSHVFLDKLLDELGLKYSFSSYKGFLKIEYDVLNYARLLIYGRILNPDSKMATLEQNDDYYTPLLAKKIQSV